MEMIVTLALLNPSKSRLLLMRIAILIQFTVPIKLDVERFAEMTKASVQDDWDEASASNERLKKYFEMTSIGYIKDPAILVDKFGRILLWYLPGILNHRLVSLFIF
jgi:hypothetical protein